VNQRRRVVGVGVAVLVVLVLAVTWVLHVRTVTHWFEIHTGISSDSGQYGTFWSGFGSDLAELGILGALATAAYHLVKKWNCHEPGCWRIGNHPAAGGQFNLCYRHHPDFMGTRPTHEVIARMHREEKERQAAIGARLTEVRDHIAAEHGRSAPVPQPPAGTGDAPVAPDPSG